MILRSRLYHLAPDEDVAPGAFDSNISKVIPLRIEGQDRLQHGRFLRIWVEDEWVMADFEIIDHSEERTVDV